MRLIDADALVAVFAADSVKFKTEEFHISAVETEIESAPTIDAVPVVHGHVVENGNPICGLCSKCGESMNRKLNICPHCGARMDGQEESS